MADRFFRNIFLSFAVVIAVLLVLFYTGNMKITSGDAKGIGFEYYQDPAGRADLEKIREVFISGKFHSDKKESFSFGNTSSTYWIRVPLGEMDPDVYKEYISIYNPTVAKTVLYLPVREKDTLSYKELPSGWSFGDEKQDEGFSYPVFRWDGNTDFERDAYIQLFSPFTQNYKIDFLSYGEFERIKRNSFMLYGILFGILLAVAIQNFFIFLELRDKANLYYFFYILLMGVYQGSLLGIYNVLIPKYSGLITGNTIALSLFAMSAVILFFRSFFRVKEAFPAYDKILKGLLISVFAGWIFLIGRQPVLANLYAHSISNVGAAFMMYAAVRAYMKGFKQARLFILGWAFMIIGLGISFLRQSGWIPNNVITINIIFIAMVIQSVLLSTALVQMVKLLTTEKENALKQYMDAEEHAASQEIAFLHAQIKPHFLYNALNVIISLCRIEPEKAEELLLNLSGFLRHSFDFHEEQKLVLLKEELEYVQAYVRIEQARFRNKLNVIYELDETTELKIPPLILQPLVENAIIHGIRKRSGSGTIVMRVEEEDHGFRIEVEDDGLGMSGEQIDRVLSDGWYKGRGVGIANINKRLLKLYGQGLEIKSAPAEGTLVSFKVPKGGGRHADGDIGGR